jgi:N-acetylglucosamine-6-phosphate deacetylase
VATHETVIQGQDAEGRELAISIAGDRITSVRIAGPQERTSSALYVLPGLVDLQLSGFEGHNLNSTAATTEDVAAVVEALWRCGVTRFCPTVGTASREDMLAAIRTITRASEKIPAVARAVIGLHVEGPYISPEDGPRGAHPKAHVRLPDDNEVQAFQDAAAGRLRVFTLAPELPGAINLIERLAGAGIVVGIGHTSATCAEIQAAVLAGARLSTHLGNGAHATLRRHPNYIWAQLAEDSLTASLIVDGHHLPPSVVKVFLRAKGPDRCVLISDANWIAGLPPGRYDHASGPVELTPQRRIRLVGTELLAGSALDLSAAVGNVTAFAHVTLAEAVAMASARPASFLGRPDLGRLSPGCLADAVLARWSPTDAGLTIVQTIVSGKPVYQA